MLLTVLYIFMLSGRKLNEGLLIIIVRPSCKFLMDITEQEVFIAVHICRIVILLFLFYFLK